MTWPGARSRRAGHEILTHVGFRLGAGYDTREIATMLNAVRPDLKPSSSRRTRIDSRWVNLRVAELREELVRVSDDVAD